jgi:predicted nucleic acid-binding protein
LPALRIAISLQHPVYDCFYLALAQAEDCPLVTADQRFLRAVAAYGDASHKAACLSLADAAMR